MLALPLASCGRDGGSAALPPAAEAAAVPATGGASATSAPVIAGLRGGEALELRYAEQFAAYRYGGGYALLDVRDIGRYLVVPPDASVPAELPGDVAVLRRPLPSVYLAAPSALALWKACGALEQLRLTSTRREDWYIPEAAAAMADGSLRYAGKYNAPDYELLLGEGCGLAVESTMILHAPKVREKLEALGIPVFVDTSSREAHPLGRLEWVRLYGLLAGQEAEAERFFAGQLALLSEGARYPATGRTVAFFYVNQKGLAAVRGGGDYIAQLIGLAGGSYVFSPEAYPDMADKGSYVPLSMEEFYQAASQADFLVYNNTMADAVKTMDGLRSKGELFSDFKAVREGRVWTIDGSLYQATDAVGTVLLDLHAMLSGAEGGLRFLERLE